MADPTLTPKPAILLLGTRGIPAAHGGFETFVENLAPYLAEQGWDTYVYCQEEGAGPIWTDSYEGVTLIHVPVKGSGTKSTIVFDWNAMRDALKRKGLLFSFGYPTGAFALLPRLAGRRHVINMDGVEWKRSQFGTIGKLAYYINERFAAAFGHRLIADHPRIADHLATRAGRQKITMIAYGAESVTDANPTLLEPLGVAPDRYGVVIARPELDNSILELVAAFSRRPRDRKLVVLGNFKPDNPYHQAVQAAASNEVIFPGAIYEKPSLHALRFHARFYAHGHRVGGTNPSLVEALGVGNAVLANDNPFNRWVADEGAIYFSTEDEIDQMTEALFTDDALVGRLRQSARLRFEAALTWPKILAEYEAMLLEEARLGGEMP
ncbi:MAG: glycosyltransferase family 1 protein [Rhodobacteraceae bacterium]|nr:glycosyltransferase family 1 protein [Paracoccaceae bacterium]